MFNKAKKHIEIPIDKKVHILTLDNRWHELFANNKTRKLKELENKLNQLIKKQGQYNNDYKDYTQLKKKIMADIVDHMSEDSTNQHVNKIMERSKKHINDINKKLEKIEKDLPKMPSEINKTNMALVEISMSICYERIIKRKKELSEMELKINSLRDELKELMVQKNESKDEYDKFYAYMHDLVGAEVIEQFDNIYFGEKDNG